MTRDWIEAFANAVVGLGISTVAVIALRATGAWEVAPAPTIAAIFFALSVARSWALRVWFRGRE